MSNQAYSAYKLMEVRELALVPSQCWARQLLCIQSYFMLSSLLEEGELNAIW